MLKDVLSYSSTIISFESSSPINVVSKNLVSKRWDTSFKDQRPRDRLRSENAGSITVLLLAVFLAEVEIIEELEQANCVLGLLAHIQRMDTEFSSLDVTDFNAVAHYFFSICSLCFEITPDRRDVFWTVANDLTGEKREELHTIVRGAIEEVHRMLIDSKGQDPLETAYGTASCLAEALVSAMTILFDHASDVDYNVRMAEVYAAAQGMTSKDRAPKNGEYEVPLKLQLLQYVDAIYVLAVEVSHQTPYAEQPFVIDKIWMIPLE
ncbi:hypothetical protein C0995_010254 [Termitomyces sp. Mi166|nr:hypothetical protein C0995_010254 [Termitomyces sp. Mi166\